MASHSKTFAATILVILVVSADSKRFQESIKGPAGAIIATAALTGQATATGTATMSWINGKGSIKVTLKGSLTNITSSNIHLSNSTLGNPIVVGILPRMSSSRPVQLNPPRSFSKGPFTLNATFDQSYLALITPGMTSDVFLSYLGRGLLYVSVRTVAQPNGAIRGALKCKGVCKEKGK